MKKVVSVVLVVLICVSLFASCGSGSVDNSSAIVGKWVWKIDTKLMNDISQAAAEGGEEGLGELLNLVFDPSIDASCNAYFTFNPDGTGKIEMNEKEFENFFAKVVKKLVDNLKKNKGLLIDIVNSQFEGNMTEKEFDEYLATTGMSWEELASTFDSAFEEIGESFIGEDSPMKDVVSDSDIKYSYQGDVLTIKDAASGILSKASKVKATIKGDTMNIDLSGEKDIPFSNIELVRVK